MQQEGYKLNKEAKKLLAELKFITKQALIQSNRCSHVSTSEWVKVRIIAAKTYYWFEKKFNKAIHILTDLCYIIPPDMLRIGEDRAGLQLYDVAEESQDSISLHQSVTGIDIKPIQGGIRFCKQVLAIDEDLDSENDIESVMGFEHPIDGIRASMNPKSPSKRQQMSNDKFQNKIFIDQQQEQ